MRILQQFLFYWLSVNIWGREKVKHFLLLDTNKINQKASHNRY